MKNSKSWIRLSNLWSYYTVNILYTLLYQTQMKVSELIDLLKERPQDAIDSFEQ